MINNEIKQRVRNILELNKEARDCDRLLTTLIWENEIEKYKNEITVFDFLIMFEKGCFTHFESIRRCRQKLQQEDESLRGLKYNKRQRLGDETRKTINK